MKYLLIILLLIVIFEGLFLFKIKTAPQKDLKCQNLEKTEKLKCGEELIEQTFEEKGLKEAFSLIDQLSTDPDFSLNCHGFAHTLGEKAYLTFFKQAKTLSFEESSTCGFGFFHGFMETLLSSGGNIKQAGDFCNSSQNPSAKGACFHGIGHGLTEDRMKEKWSTEDDLVKTPLSSCEQLSSDQAMVERCASGVFNVMAIRYICNDSSFGEAGKQFCDWPGVHIEGSLTLNKEDPLNYCKSQKKPSLKRACFGEMNTTLLALTANDFVKAAKFFEDLETEYQEPALWNLAFLLGFNSTRDYYPKQVENCNLIKNFKNACIKGFVSGVIFNQTPSSQEGENLDFCNFSKEYAEVCYQEGRRSLSVFK